jgi:EmrB/QacA subfamily drug resistance transporter
MASQRFWRRKSTSPPAARPGVVLACVSACTILVVGFVASINLAVPVLAAGDLHPTSGQLLWIVDVYVVLFACLVIPAGAAGDRFGRKGVLLTGLVLFALGAVVSASAADVAVMITGRVITGIGAACVLPNSLAVLIHATAPTRRTHVIAVWASMSGIGGVIGNVGGGALLATGSWRWLFAAVVPIALACAVWVMIAAPRTGRHSRDLGVGAAVLLTLATLALLTGIIEGPDRGWGDAVVLGGFAAAAILFGMWAIVELRSRHPLLDPRLFAIPVLRAASLGMLIMFFGSYGLFYLNASLLQYGRGYTALQAGIGVVPMIVPLLVGARYVPVVVARVGMATTLTVGFLATSAGLYGLARAVEDPYPVYAWWLLVFGAGFALALPCLTAEITAGLPPEQAGVGAGLQATTRELGSALGVAVIGSLTTAHFAARLTAATGIRDHLPPTVADALAALDTRQHQAVIDAFTAGSATALRSASLIVLAAGALVVAQILWADRRRPASPPIPRTGEPAFSE